MIGVFRCSCIAPWGLVRVLRSAVGAGQERYYATAKATQGPMTSSIHNSNDLVSSQKEKLEWVTPQISVMGTEYTEGGKEFYNAIEFSQSSGPS